MITLTPSAIKQTRISIREGNIEEGMALRIAAKENADGSYEYGLGFDEIKDDDMVFKFEDVQVVIAPHHGPLLKDAIIDFVEIEEGQYNFIFLNPNDPNYVPPKEDAMGGGSCGA